MDQLVQKFLILAIASSCSFCQELPVNYDAKSVAGIGAGMCPNTQGIVEEVRQDIDSLINGILPVMIEQGHAY